MPSTSPQPSSARPSALLPILLLAVVVWATTLACAGGTDGADATAADGGGAAVEDSEATGSGDGDAVGDAGASGELPPMPEAAAEDGTLPRTYLGWELGGPAPDVERSAEDPRYDSTVRYWKKVSDSPNTFHRAFVQDGKIFRIEWMVKAPGLDRAEVAAALAEHLGEPDEKSPYLPDNHELWSDGLTEGKTTWWVGRPHNGDFLVVAVMDSWLDSDAISI